MKRRSSYKVTFFDRHGPAGEHRLKAVGYGMITFGVSIPMFLLLGVKLGLGLFGSIALTLVGGTTLAAAAGYMGLVGGQAAGDMMKYVTAGGSSTPYEEQFSQEQALVMQREYATALALFEQRIALSPGEPRVRMAAADLYATHGENPKRAAELYREVQRIPDVLSGHDIYVSNKLADLYLGPLKEPRRALVEFRRLAERYPGSVAADHAKLALSNLKTDLMSDESRDS